MCSRSLWPTLASHKFLKRDPDLYLLMCLLSTLLQVHSHINKSRIISESCHEFSEKDVHIQYIFFTQLIARLCIYMCVYLYIYASCGFFIHECKLNVPLSHIYLYKCIFHLILYTRNLRLSCLKKKKEHNDA
jgi:hypothetical protein